MDGSKLKVIKSVLNSRGRQRLKLIKQPSIQKLLREICVNVLRGNVPLSTNQRRKLKPHAASIRKLALKKTSLKNRYKLVQKGGFLPFLLKPLIALAASSLGGLITSRLAKK